MERVYQTKNPVRTGELEALLKTLRDECGTDGEFEVTTVRNRIIWTPKVKPANYISKSMAS